MLYTRLILLQYVKGILPVLNTLQMTHNKLRTADDIADLAHCKELKIVDLSHNYIVDPKIIEVNTTLKAI